jgi:hypothetical protein
MVRGETAWVGQPQAADCTEQGLPPRKLNAEAGVQEIELPVVLLGELVPTVDEHLHLRTQAVDRVSVHPPPPGEAIRGIHPLAPVLHEIHAAAAVFVEQHRVDIDLAPDGIDEDKALRRSPTT